MKQMVYSVSNLPNALSKLLQAQMRDVAGSLDVDRIIEDTAILDRVAGELDVISRGWGVSIEMIKIQRVETGSLSEVLAQKKNADFKNKEVIITAKTNKQTCVINAEGQRDQKIREAEGEAQRIIASGRSKLSFLVLAHGQAQAILNEAESEAQAIQDISRSLEGSGEDPTKYLLALKYINVLKTICTTPKTKVIFVPQETLMVQTAQLLGLNTILPPCTQRPVVFCVWKKHSVKLLFSLLLLLLRHHLLLVHHLVVRHLLIIRHLLLICHILLRRHSVWHSACSR